MSTATTRRRIADLEGQCRNHLYVWRRDHGRMRRVADALDSIADDLDALGRPDLGKELRSAGMYLVMGWPYARRPRQKASR